MGYSVLAVMLEWVVSVAVMLLRVPTVTSVPERISAPRLAVWNV